MILRKSVKESFSLILNEPLILIPGIFSSTITALLLFFFSFDIAQLNFSSLEEKFSSLLPLIFFFLFLNTFLTSLIIRVTYDKKTKNFEIKNCVKKVFKQYLKAFLGFIFYLLICGIGLLAFIIPGIILMSKFFFYQVIILTEEKGILHSFKKSWKITRIYWRKVLILVLIYIILWLFLRILISIPSIISFFFYFFISILFIPFYFVFITITFLKLKATRILKHRQD